MRRKDVTRRMTSVAEVRASTHAHRPQVGQLLDERSARPDGEGYSQAYFDHMDSELATVESHLVTAEDAHVRKQIQIVEAQELAERLSSKVYGKQTSARQILIGLYGPEHQFKLAAVSGKTPQGPQTLPEQVDQTVKLLRNPESDPPAVKVGGVAVDFGAMADDLEADLANYRSARIELERRRKEGDATRLTTNQAIETFDKVFPWVASSLEGTFRLVGERELANRIRTSVRRVNSRREEEEEETAKSADSASASSPEKPPVERSAAEPSAQVAEAT